MIATFPRRLLAFATILLALAACKSDDKPRRPREPKPPAVEQPAPVEQPVPVTDCTAPRNGDGAGHVAMQACIEILPCGDRVQRDDGIHYVTMAANPPLGGVMTLVYEIEASAGAVFVPTEGDSSPRLTLYFQRKGDNWSASGKYASYRWFSATRKVVTAGEHIIQAPMFFASWRAVKGASGNEGNFAAAAANAGRVGFVLGGGNVGHGICMKSGSAKILVKSFTVQ